MSWRRAYTSGWAAFEDDHNPFGLADIQDVTDLVDFGGVQNVDHANYLAESSQSRKMAAEDIENNVYELYEMLKELYPWANKNLIEEVMAAVDHDIEKASSLLGEMASPCMLPDDHNPFIVADFQDVPELVDYGGVPNVVRANYPMENSQSEKMAAEYTEDNVSELYDMLKELYPWANKTLIEDIMTAVDYDIEEALSLLGEMASLGMLQEKKEAESNDDISELCMGSPVPQNMDLCVGEAITFRESAGDSQNSLAIKDDELFNDHAFDRKVLLDDEIVNLGLLMDRLSMKQVEPEREDDDLYLKHRKEAINSMRLASQYSKAATEAYLRKDHAAAKEFSRKAREERSNSKRLNAKAAKEILAIKNAFNDDWKLDLHGLHIAEAVQALQERLLEIESAGVETEKLDRQQNLSGPRLLEVITGKGNHSQGEPVLPIAIKSFLSENRYGFYEERLGVITVLPKFCQW